MADAIGIDFSRTKRIVLLIDLNPLLQFESQSQNPNPNYVSSILTASNILFSFPALSSSLFSYKLFFSSLSPLRSASNLHRLLLNQPSTSLSFNSPSQTLDSLSQALNSITSTHLTPSPSNASHTASSLVQLVHDYDWESQIENLSGTPHHDPMGICSNLIILFSPVCRSLKCLAEFMCVDINDKSSTGNLDAVIMKFRDCFGVVNDAFNSRDIHFCWIDIDSHEEKAESHEYEEHYTLLVNEIRRFGWGFSSTSSIVLGSALVPFGLIYPNIGMSCKFLDCHRLDKRICGQLNLEIADVSGKPLECKCCDLELLPLKVLAKLRSDDILAMEVASPKDRVINLDKAFLGIYRDQTMNLRIKAVRRYTEWEKMEESSFHHFLVQSAESDKKKKSSLDSSFADRVLGMLANDKSELFQRHPVPPIWQIFLNFLYREGYWALLSISNSKGVSFFGILKPFTVHSAFLSITDDNHCFNHYTAGSNMLMVEHVMSQSDIDSQKGTSASGKHVHVDCGKRRNNRKHSYQDLTWSSFGKAAFEFPDLDLAEVYFTRDIKNSKKLKFLKCWMKQVKKHGLSHEKVPDESCQTASEVAKPIQQIETYIDEKLTVTCHESDEHLSRQFCSDQSRMQEDTAFESCLETAEAFFTTLPKKIRHGLESDGVDLQIFAERLVNSSIYWLNQKYETVESDEESCVGRIAELIKLLLREPKDLKGQKDNNPSRLAPNPCSSSENLIKEYEFQLFLRMEILRSEYAESIEGFMKQKLVKQICSFLEIIQFLVEGGFHGDVSLYEYVERTIKMRYSQNLGDVVNKIYDQMDLLPFGEENEAAALLLNSEDSNHSWREKQERYGIAETNKTSDSVSAEDEPSRPFECVDKNHEGTSKGDHARKLSEARERRERARRFVSFTSRMPDLQRVWAPKQSKAIKVKPESLAKDSKRKRCRGASYSIVCETPLTVKEPLSSQGEENQCISSNSTVYKALFQDQG